MGYLNYQGRVLDLKIPSIYTPFEKGGFRGIL
jgi:hypothetical protein